MLTPKIIEDLMAYLRLPKPERARQYLLPLLSKVMKVLPSRYEDVLRLHYFDVLDPQQIALLCDMNPSDVDPRREAGLAATRDVLVTRGWGGDLQVETVVHLFKEAGAGYRAMIEEIEEGGSFRHDERDSWRHLRLVKGKDLVAMLREGVEVRHHHVKMLTPEYQYAANTSQSSPLFEREELWSYEDDAGNYVALFMAYDGKIENWAIGVEAHGIAAFAQYALRVTFGDPNTGAEITTFTLPFEPRKGKRYIGLYALPEKLNVSTVDLDLLLVTVGEA